MVACHYGLGMVTDLEKLAKQALSLPSAERLSLARRLLESAEPEIDDEIERAWEEEIERRIAEIDNGTAKGRSWKEIKQDFDARFRH